ncbi:transcriptional regulator GutM [Planococcus sp. CP5-4_UN]|uniref:transcriptional regulator GutM n=1 Tax=Planococcus sp. CP5-4_UN TaxID=2850852 RepID=UPI00349F6800
MCLFRTNVKKDWRGFVLWGWFIALFAGIWILQILMTKVQLRNYQATIKKMSNRPSGYLGVGIQKQKLGIGVIAILVTDEEGLLIESQLMKGVTVFSRFEAFPKYNGLYIEHLKEKLNEDSDGQAFKMAIEKIEMQMSKKTNLAV